MRSRSRRRRPSLPPGWVIAALTPQASPSLGQVARRTRSALPPRMACTSSPLNPTSSIASVSTHWPARVDGAENSSVPVGARATCSTPITSAVCRMALCRRLPVPPTACSKERNADRAPPVAATPPNWSSGDCGSCRGFRELRCATTTGFVRNAQDLIDDGRRGVRQVGATPAVSIQPIDFHDRSRSEPPLPTPPMTPPASLSKRSAAARSSGGPRPPAHPGRRAGRLGRARIRWQQTAHCRGSTGARGCLSLRSAACRTSGPRPRQPRRAAIGGASALATRLVHVGIDRPEGSGINHQVAPRAHCARSSTHRA